MKKIIYRMSKRGKRKEGGVVEEEDEGKREG